MKKNHEKIPMFLDCTFCHNHINVHKMLTIISLEKMSTYRFHIFILVQIEGPVCPKQPKLINWLYNH